MKKPNQLIYIPLLAFAIIIGIGLYAFVKITSLSSKLALVSERLEAIDARLASTTAMQVELSKESTENFKRLSGSIAYVEQKVGVFKEQVSSVSSTVSTLDKLSKTDPQLLAKYSKVFFLNENYAPARLSEVVDPYKYSTTKAVSVHADILAPLKKMIDDARNDGVNMFVSSGYRSFTEQKNLKSDYKVTYGAGTANQFSADQGYSEHQLGTTVDFTTPELKGELDGFEATRAYTWLKNNAHRYGFILSYPPNNQYYQFEPWHWRYVGIKLATDLHTAGQNFYDWDQRKIDTYLVSLF
jgi:LAS superfamily LD-carboxypeptidase LdcB